METESVRGAPLAASLALCVTGCDALTSPAVVTHMQRADWGFQIINTMPTPPDDPRLACGVVVPTDSKAGTRAACAYGAGSRASDSLGIDDRTASAIPIRHVIVLMKENRSFDHLFGKLHDRGQPGVEAVPPEYTNPDQNGRAVSPMHASTTCIRFDPNHQSKAVAHCIDGGKMDGFVRNAAESTASDGTFVMGFYDDTDLPFYYWLAATFAVADRHFAPMVGGTFSNRNFMMFGTSENVVDTGIVFPPPTTPSIFVLLINAGFTWRAYTDGSPLSGTLDWSRDDPGVSTMLKLYDDLDNGTLPNVAFVDGVDNKDDDHPPADLQRGEAVVKTIYDHAKASPQWGRLAIVWTYDEGGAFADHVPPPSACQADSVSPFTEMGPRVPLVVISPWAKRNYVSHIVHDHAAITRLIETLFDLPALSARDANSDALFDLFDFSCGRDLSVPQAPDAGTGICPFPSPSAAN